MTFQARAPTCVVLQGAWAVGSDAHSPLCFGSLLSVVSSPSCRQGLGAAVGLAHCQLQVLSPGAPIWIQQAGFHTLCPAPASGLLQRLIPAPWLCGSVAGTWSPSPRLSLLQLIKCGCLLSEDKVGYSLHLGVTECQRRTQFEESLAGSQPSMCLQGLGWAGHSNPRLWLQLAVCLTWHLTICAD